MAAPTHPSAQLRAIGDLARELTVSPRTIRYYEELGLIGRARRRGRRRVYGPDEAARLRFIQKLKLLGLSLEEIGELSAVHRSASTRGMLQRLVPKLDKRLSEIDDRLRQLSALREEIRSYRHKLARRLEANR
jgi:DNA-binding transcriptional MerR regulator